MKKINFNKLINKGKGGDEAALTKLYNLTYNDAYFIAFQIVKDEYDAQDILQDCYVQAFQKLSILRNPSSFQPWFNRIVSNKAIDVYSKEKKFSIYRSELFR